MYTCMILQEVGDIRSMNTQTRLVWSKHRGAGTLNAPIANRRTAELRKSNRYRLSAPVFIFWAPQTGPAQSSEGITVDISATGVYVTTNEIPPVGELVQIDILLPNLVPDGSGIHLTGEGVVLRAELRCGKLADTFRYGFAVSVRFYPELSKPVLSYLRGSLRVI